MNKTNFSIITFNKENECEIQDGIRPNSIMYSGLISNITDDFLLQEIEDMNYNQKTDDKYVLIIKL